MEEKQLTRKEQYLTAIVEGDTSKMPEKPLTREEVLLEKIAKKPSGSVSEEVIERMVQDNLGENVVTTEEVPIDNEGFVLAQADEVLNGLYNKTRFNSSEKGKAYVFDVTEGDKFRIITTSGYNIPTYVFLSSNDTIVSYSDVKANALDVVDKIIEIPSGVSRLAVNNNNSTTFSTIVYKYGVTTNKELKISSNNIHASVLKDFSASYGNNNKLTPYEEVTGKFANRSGSFSNSASSTVKKYHVTKGQRLVIKGGIKFALAFYQLRYTDGDKFLYGYPETSGTIPIVEDVEQVITIPDNGLYLCVNTFTDAFNTEVYDITDGTNEILPNTTRYNGNVLYGKKWCVCGDSFTAGVNELRDPVTQIIKTYDYFIANRNNMKRIKLAQGGNDFTNIEGAIRPFSNPETDPVNYTNIPSDCDYVTLQFGLNESDLTTEQIGTKTDSDNTTLWGAYNVILESILTNNPNVKIGIIISDAWMTQSYHDALIEIAQYWGVPYLDLKDGASLLLGAKLSTTVNPRAIELRKSVWETMSHPNDAGHEYRSTIIENFLRSL